MSKAMTLTDIKVIRERARSQSENGAVTESYHANRTEVIQLLNAALATELVCFLRYKYHYFMASGINATQVAAEFLEHAAEEQLHADELAERIVQLGGKPNFSPDGLLTRSHSEYIEGSDLRSMIQENLVAERIAVESYTELIRYIGDDDPTTCRMLREILAVEEKHADDLVDFLQGSDQGLNRSQPVTEA